MKETDKTPEELYEEREKRINDAISLKVPDRVPVICSFGLFPARYTGITIQEAMYDYDKSPDQFKTFYWPTLKKLIIGLIDNDLNPFVFWEGDCTSRLELIGDIPKGKAVYYFEQTDIFRAKEILGSTVCIRGNVPLSIMCMGKPDDVKDYCRKLIDVVGKDGGFIMDASTDVEDAKPENIKAMIDFTKEYGVY